MLIIGIDPGKENGFACWFPAAKKFSAIKTLKTYEVLEHLMGLIHLKEPFKVVIEDPYSWRYHGKSQSNKLQGAGAVKARFKAIIEFLEAYDIPYEKKSIQGTVKYDAKTFKQMTGYQLSTSQHGRDAAMMVFGRK
jgi:hypothetical protein